VIRQASGHGRCARLPLLGRATAPRGERFGQCDPQAGVVAREVVVGQGQVQMMYQVLPLLGEAQRLAMQAAEQMA